MKGKIIVKRSFKGVILFCSLVFIYTASFGAIPPNYPIEGGKLNEIFKTKHTQTFITPSKEVVKEWEKFKTEYAGENKLEEPYVEWNTSTGYPHRIYRIKTPPLEGHPKDIVIDFLKKHSMLFPIDTNLLRYDGLHRLSENEVRPIFTQVYKGIEIESSIQTNMREIKKDTYTIENIIFYYFPNIEVDIIPKTSMEEVINIAKENHQKFLQSIIPASVPIIFKEFTPTRLIILPPGGCEGIVDNFYLTWAVGITTQSPISSRTYLIDAHTGEILIFLDNMRYLNSNLENEGLSMSTVTMTATISPTYIDKNISGTEASFLRDMPSPSLLPEKFPNRIIVENAPLKETIEAVEKFMRKYGTSKTQVEWNKFTGYPFFIAGFDIPSIKGIPTDIALNFLTEHKELFGIEPNDLKYSSTEQGWGGEYIITVSFSQVYKGLPVKIAPLKDMPLTIFSEGKVRMVMIKIAEDTYKIGNIFSYYFPGININTTPNITKEKAIEIIKGHYSSLTGTSTTDEEIKDVKLNTLFCGPEGFPLLGWSAKTSRFTYIIDAMCGEILAHYYEIGMMKQYVENVSPYQLSKDKDDNKISTIKSMEKTVTITLPQSISLIGTTAQFFLDKPKSLSKDSIKRFDVRQINERIMEGNFEDENFRDWFWMQGKRI